MSDTTFAFGDPRAQTKWSLDVFDYALQNIRLKPLMGMDKKSLIRLDVKLTTEKGGTIIVQSRTPLSGAGQGDDGNTTGNEESLKRRNMSVEVHERAHSYVSAGKISEQLTATNIRSDGKEDLGEWFGEAMENDLVNSAAGLYNVNSSSNDIQTINESYPTSDRIHYGGQNAAGTLGNSGVAYASDALLTAGTQASNLMGTKVLEKVKRLALAATPRFKKVKILNLNGVNPDDPRSLATAPVAMEALIVLLHPLQIKAIKAETGTAGWKAVTAAAQTRGSQNPIFAGAEFIWDGMVVWEYDRIPIRTGAGGTALPEGFLLNAGRTATTDACAISRTVCRGLLMGASAMSFAWAQKMKWYEDVVDARKPKVVVDAIYGVKRINFNAHGTTNPTSDEAIFCMDSEVIVDG